MLEEQPLLSSASPALLVAAEEPSSFGHGILMALGKVLFAALPVAGIAIGATYLGQCPRQPLLPVYLVVLGSVVLLLLLLSCTPCEDGTGQPSACARCCQGSCILFLFCWFIAGNVWIYPIYPPDYEDPGHPRFCQQVLFLFAFGITTMVHATLAVVLLLTLCILAGVFGAVLPYGGHGDRGGP
ncbi:transmembrane protein 272-like [Varanus komodoensis]|uniref:Transmembrane protein 272 n=1 Tax=Varanus komodoensis TaxID=61221 RepID=A0A8D2IVS0_VARKO|nr:transmembrane protein 272-like [Varanus komodoensis]XP_044282725.1 transmembrane protein 272-like [Varanus komodoensis]XP_044282726.1 transmembrane protein 272-like [Varanus komodoensis]